jgi:sugar lactone lactonase YvrE
MTTRVSSVPAALSKLGAIAAAILLSGPPAAEAQSDYTGAYTWVTVAGKAAFAANVDGTGTAARFIAPSGVAVDSNGNVYVADQAANTIRKITPGGVTTTLAGSPGVSGSADGTGSAARFNIPVGVAVDSSGNVYVADTSNETIRKITPAGVVTTIAGTVGTSGTLDGTGTAAQFSTPTSLAVDGSGNIYVVDQTDDTIRKVTSGGVVTTIAGSVVTAGATNGSGSVARFNSPYGIAIDGSGNLYVADTGNGTIRKIDTSGNVTTLAGSPKVSGYADGTGAAAEFRSPLGVAADSSGNVYVSDTNNNVIRKITPAGVVTTFAGLVPYVGWGNGTGAGAEFNTPFGIAVDSNGNVYVADQGNTDIRKISPGGTSTTLAGQQGGGNADGSGSAAGFDFPTGAAADTSGNIYIADEQNDEIRKMTPSGTVSTVAGAGGSAGATDATGTSAQFDFPFGVAVDGSGNTYVADATNNTIRKITSSGVVTTLAGLAGSPGSVDGTGSAARFDQPIGVAVDGNGNVYVSEQRNATIRKITPAGVVSTLAGLAGSNGSTDGTGSAARFYLPAGLAIDSSGNIFVADATADEIRKVTPGGVVTTIAGSPQSAGSNDGTGSAAQFFFPVGLAIDSSGNLFVADANNNEIRKVTPAGVVTTLGGSAPPSRQPGQAAPPPGFADGTGSAAQFNNPEGIALDASGNVYVADSGNNIIRKGSLSAAPQIISQPTSQFTSVGGSATFSVSASGSSALSYQWSFNGSAISGATGSSYTVTNAQASNAGNYSVTVTDSNGSVTSSTVSLSVGTGSTGARLINISTRAMVGTGPNILIPGFYISGTGTETLLIRADGPALTAFGVSGALASPTLSVYDSGGTLIAQNAGWGSGTAANTAQIVSVSAQVGAFALTPGSADCAVIVNLSPGAYTVHIAGVGATSGVALAEVYEVSSTGTRLSNISTRAMVGTGANLLIPGFVVSGSGNERVLVRADGPALTTFGVGGSLANTSIEVINQGGTTVDSNTGWSSSTNAAELPNIAASVGAFALTPNSGDSADVVNLTAGPYTMQVSGVGGTTGVALAEIYEVP